MESIRRYPLPLAFLHQALVHHTNVAVELYDQCLWEYQCVRDRQQLFLRITRVDIHQHMACMDGHPHLGAWAFAVGPTVLRHQLSWSARAACTARCGICSMVRGMPNTAMGGEGAC